MTTNRMERLSRWLEEPFGTKKYKPFKQKPSSAFGLVTKAEHDRVVADNTAMVTMMRNKHAEEIDQIRGDMAGVFDKFHRVRIDQYDNRDILCCTAEVTKMMLENLRPGDERYIDYLGEDLKRKIVRELKHYLHTRETHQVHETKNRYVFNDFEEYPRD